MYVCFSLHTCLQDLSTQVQFHSLPPFHVSPLPTQDAVAPYKKLERQFHSELWSSHKQLMCITQSKHCTLCLQAQRLQLSHWPPSTALQPCWNTAGPKLYLTVWNSSTGLFFSCLTSASPLFTVNLSASETPKALYHIKQSCLQNSSWCYEFWSTKED